MSLPAPTRLASSQHHIDAERIDGNSLDVIAKLTEAGFEAYLVGGCVRDLLLDQTPKDYDVATNATPEDVKQALRRVRLVGRRFRIAHVRYGRELIEVSTFRRAEADGIETSEDGMILRDNQFGTLAEDAFRRDFTINALYYDPSSGEVIDFVGGLDDLAARRLNFIGNTRTRLVEDPVRVLRALRFHAKLGFDMADEIKNEMSEAAERLLSIPPARLFEEFNKLFMLGYAERAWAAIASSPVREFMFPCTDPDCAIVASAMQNTDQRISEEKPVTPGFLFAAMLWRDFTARASELLQTHSPQEAGASAAHDVIEEQSEIVAMPRRFAQFAREVWLLQHRLENRPPRAVGRIVTHQRFRAAFDLLELRAQDNEELRPVYEWWETFQFADSDKRGELVRALPNSGGRKRRRRRRKPKGEPGNS